MNTLQIHNLLKTNIKTKSIFKGVFLSDQLPKGIPKYPSLIIADTDTSDQPGTHGIAFYSNVANKQHSLILMNNFPKKGIRDIFKI